MANPKNTDFDNFVREQQDLAAEAAAETQTPFDPKKELNEWLERLNALYSEIHEYLKDYISARTVSTAIDDIELNEEFSGAYSAPKLTIRIGLQEVKLVPIGTMLIGSRGRVDVIGRAGTSRLVLINKQVTSRNQLVSITVVDPKNPKPARKAESRQIEWAWKIVSRPPAMTFVELNKESFLQLMLEVTNA